MQVRLPKAHGFQPYNHALVILKLRAIRTRRRSLITYLISIKSFYITALSICCISTIFSCLTYDSKGDARNGEQLYNRISVLRAERGLSRQALADALGINYQTVGYLERGDYNPSLELAFRISEFFRLPVEAIFSRTPFRPLSEQVYGPAGRSGSAQ